VDFLSGVKLWHKRTRALAKTGIFLGIFVRFLEYLDWLGPNHKYFLEAGGPATTIPIRTDQGTIYIKHRDLKAKQQEIKDFLDLFSSRKILVDQVHGWWTGCTAGAPWSMTYQALGLTGARQ
jgi:hypothetical protein